MEICGLKKDYVDFGDRTITVYGKGRNGQPKKATIALSTELRESFGRAGAIQPTRPTMCLRSCRRARRSIQKPAKSISVGSTTPSRNWALGRLGDVMERQRPGSRISSCTTAATPRRRGWRKVAANIKIVQKLMRHSDIATTAKYMAVYDDDIREAMEAETQSRAVTRLLADQDAAQSVEAEENPTRVRMLPNQTRYQTALCPGVKKSVWFLIVCSSSFKSRRKSLRERKGHKRTFLDPK